MILTVILTGASVILAILTVAFLLILQYQRSKAALIAAINQFFNAPDEKTPSPLAQIVDNVSLVLARRIVEVAKMTLLGMKSGQTRSESGVEADIQEVLLSQNNPLVSMVINSIPALRKKARKNPAIAAVVETIVNKFGGLGGPSGNGSRQAGLPFKDGF